MALGTRSCFWGIFRYVGTGKFSKIHLDVTIIITTTDEHYIIRILNCEGVFGTVPVFSVPV